MNPSTAAMLAQVFSLGMYAMIARLYVVPWIRTRDRADALVPLLWVHAFRYVALHLIDAQSSGYAISDRLRDRIIYGDLFASTRQQRRWRRGSTGSSKASTSPSFR
jgi:hypothetical protein